MSPTWQAAERYLLASARFGRRPGLHRIRALLARLGDPHLAVPYVVHVGGTNGKGSVVACLDAVLRAAGLRVARFTSPHLHHFRERIAVDGRPIAAGELARILLDVIAPAAEAVAEQLGDPPVTFELLTAAAYVHCRELGIPWLVQEVGLGGRHDATNVIPRPVVTVITNVALDHTERLGATIEAIAAEKAGIIKPGTPVVTAARGIALERLAAAARRAGAGLTVVVPAGAGPVDPADPLDPVDPLDPADPDAGASPWCCGWEAPRRYTWETLALGPDGGRMRLTGPDGRDRDFPVALRGAHQLENAAVAAAAIDRLLDGPAAAAAPGLNEASLAAGLASARCPGRLTLIPEDPPVLLDAAHNEAGMTALRRAVAQLFPGHALALIVGATTDRDVGGLLRPWAGSGAACAALTVPSSRAVPAAELVEHARRVGLPAAACADLESALAHARRALARRGEPGLIVVCGSILVVAAALQRLGSGREAGDAVPKGTR